MKILKKVHAVNVSFAVFSTLCVLPFLESSAETIGRWSFDGTVGETVAIGTQFMNKVDESKFPAEVVNRHGSASTGHLSSISTFDDINGAVIPSFNLLKSKGRI